MKKLILLLVSWFILTSTQSQDYLYFRDSTVQLKVQKIGRLGAKFVQDTLLINPNPVKVGRETKKVWQNLPVRKKGINYLVFRLRKDNYLETLWVGNIFKGLDKN